jgi:anthranilate phosphoribosyltransferase
MTYSELVQPLLERRDFTEDQAREVMRFLISGDASDAQIGGFLLALRVKGCTTRELAAFASVMREKALMVVHPFDDLVDTCGTGGGIPSFNLSTAAAFVACGAGVRIAKHGNRSVTGLGSAEVLEALGVSLASNPDQLAFQLETVRMAFLFAQAHHPAMRHVAKPRRELGLRTVFNQLGPLANPAGAKRQLIGVYDPAIMRSMGEALRVLEAERAIIVHGKDGLDEASAVTETSYVKVWDGEVTTGTFRPQDFGIDPISADALTPGTTPSESAAILKEAITDLGSLRSQAILPSAAIAIWLSGLEDGLLEATERAKDSIREGKAIKKLEELISAGANN